MIKLMVLAAAVGYVHSQSDTDVKNLLTDLFTTQAYNKLVRPTTTQSVPTLIRIEFILNGINGVDEVEQKLTTTGYLEIYWIDELLTWNPETYGGRDFIHVPQSDIWLPDIALHNGFKDLEGLGSSFINVVVDSTGLAVWYPFHVFESKCTIDSTYFPFEKQTCNIDFIAWSLNSDDVTLLVGTDGILTDSGADSNGQWNLTSSSSSSFSESGESKVRFSLMLQRKPLFHIINIIIPIILLSILNIFTFEIPADNGERMGYTVTVWLSFAVFLTVISSSLPQSSDSTPVLSIYIMIQLAVGTISVLLSSWESRAVTRPDETPVPSYMRFLARLLRRKCCKRNNCTTKITSERDNVAQDQQETDDRNVHWKEGVEAIDFICFWSLTIILSISTVVFFTICATN